MLDDNPWSFTISKLEINKPIVLLLEEQTPASMIPICEGDTVLIDGVCEVEQEIITCEDGYELIEDECQLIAEPIECTEPQILVEGECVDPEPTEPTSRPFLSGPILIGVIIGGVGLIGTVIFIFIKPRI